MISYIFGDESGDFKTKPYFLIGLLKTTRADYFEKRIDRLRQDHNFNFEFKYSSTNRLKVGLCKAVIDLFFNSPDLDFRCIVKSNLVFDLEYFKNNHLGIAPQDMAYNKTYCEVIKHNICHNEKIIVYIDDKSRTKKDNLLFYLKESIPQIVDVQPRNSKDLNLLQLADLIIGSIYGNLTGNNHPVKKELQDHLLGYLPVKDFKEKLVVQKFNVWHWKAKQNQNPPCT